MNDDPPRGVAAGPAGRARRTISAGVGRGERGRSAAAAGRAMAEPRDRLADRTPLLGHSTETARPSRCDAFNGAHPTPAGSPPRSARISRPLARSKPKPSLRRQVQQLRLCPSAALRSLRQSSAIRGRARADRNRWWCGVKPGDCYAVPLCTAYHANQDRIGELSVWSALRIDPLNVSLRLWIVSGDEKAGARTVFRARQRIDLAKAHSAT